MTHDDGLDRLSSAELHDLATLRARHHLDVRYFIHLMEYLPAAEAAAGPGSFAPAFLDALHGLDDAALRARARIA